MAPRLQQRAINLAMSTCNKEGYIIPPSFHPLLFTVEPFLLEEKKRKASFAIVENKVLHESAQKIQWAALLLRWTRLWNIEPTKAALAGILDKLIPEAIQESVRHLWHEDVIHLVRQLKEKTYGAPVVRIAYHAGLKSAKAISDADSLIHFAYQLAFRFMDQDAWSILYEKDRKSAEEILVKFETMYDPGVNYAADDLLLHGWRITG